MKPTLRSVLLIVICLPAIVRAGAQAGLDQAVAAKFPLTKASADRAEIVTAGAVMDLKKDGLLMFAIDAKYKAQLLYRDGHIQPTTATKMLTVSFMGHSSADIVKRTFVAGEKLWLIDVQTASDGINLQLLSDAINDVRYTAVLRIPFAKGSNASADQVITQVSQVLAPESADGKPQEEAAAPAPPAPAPAVQPALPQPKMADIAPPPPPTDEAPPAALNLEKGQTKDQVVAALGKPVKVVKMGTKEIDYYKDMKVTFVNNKVSNIE